MGWTVRKRSPIYPIRCGAVNWVVVVICTIFAIIVSGLVVLSSGVVEGIEHHPLSMTFRRFHYWELPVVHLQITPIYRLASNQFSTADPSVSQYFKAPFSPQLDRWDLVEFHRVGADKQRGEAAILAQLVQHDPMQQFSWSGWSTDHPKRAAELWPAVQDLSIIGMYWGVPKLFDLYRAAEENVTFQPERDQLMIDICRESAEELIAQELWDEADATVKVGQKYGSDSRLDELSKQIATKTNAADLPGQ